MISKIVGDRRPRGTPRVDDRIYLMIAPVYDTPGSDALVNVGFYGYCQSDMHLLLFRKFCVILHENTGCLNSKHELKVFGVLFLIILCPTYLLMYS